MFPTILPWRYGEDGNHDNSSYLVVLSQREIFISKRFCGYLHKTFSCSVAVSLCSGKAVRRASQWNVLPLSCFLNVCLYAWRAEKKSKFCMKWHILHKKCLTMLYGILKSHTGDRQFYSSWIVYVAYSHNYIAMLDKNGWINLHYYTLWNDHLLHVACMKLFPYFIYLTCQK